MMAVMEPSSGRIVHPRMPVIRLVSASGLSFGFMDGGVTAAGGISSLGGRVMVRHSF